MAKHESTVSAQYIYISLGSIFSLGFFISIFTREPFLFEKNLLVNSIQNLLSDRKKVLMLLKAARLKVWGCGREQKEKRKRMTKRKRRKRRRSRQWQWLMRKAPRLRRKRRPRASNGQRYPLPCCAHFRFLKCCTAGQRVLLTIAGPKPSFLKY